MKRGFGDLKTVWASFKNGPSKNQGGALCFLPHLNHCQPQEWLLQLINSLIRRQNNFFITWQLIRKQSILRIAIELYNILANWQRTQLMKFTYILSFWRNYILSRANLTTTLRSAIIEGVVKTTVNGKAGTTRVQEGFLDSMSCYR